MPSYYLPPVAKKVPYPERTPEIRSPAYRRAFLWFFRGAAHGDPGTVIGGVSYQGGRWNGPLSAGEITAITAAGFGSRIYTVTDLIQLPAYIPADIA